jgi:hypothetical protein
MLYRRRVGVFAVVVALTVTGIYAYGAKASNWWWREEGAIIKSNTEILASGSAKLRSQVGTTKVVIDCTNAAFVKGAVIFNGKNHGGLEVGREQSELELTGCKPTSVCTEVEGAKITIPASGNADSTVVYTRNNTETTNLYVDTLPLGEDFTKFNLRCSGVLVGVTISTAVKPSGFGEVLEGEGGLLAQVDKDAAEAKAEKAEHKLKYECSGETQMPEQVYNSVSELVIVDKLKYEAKEACVEGELAMKLTSGKLFSLE